MTYQFHPTVLREYDIRGIMNDTLGPDDAYAIGRAFASFKPEWKTAKPRIAVGRDGRKSSPALEAALVKGLTESGGRGADWRGADADALFHRLRTRA